MGRWGGWRDRIPLAWRMLTHRPRLLVVSVAAVAFATLIVFTQLGFMNGLYDSQTNLFEQLRADLVMTSTTQHLLVLHEDFPRDRLEQALAVPGVAAAVGLRVEYSGALLRNPRTGGEHAIRAIGLDPAAEVFESAGIQSQLERLRPLGRLLFDRRSRAYYGDLAPGTWTELSGRRALVAGRFELGADFYYDGNVLLSDETFLSLFPHARRDRVRFGLLQLTSGFEPEQVLAELQGILPPDVDVAPKQRVVARERAAWQRKTPAGYMFGLGVAIGCVIGAVFCYQILYTGIADHLPQIATLKAIGYGDLALVALVLEQALTLGLLAFPPALLASAGVYGLIAESTGVVMRLTIGRAVLVLLLSLATCAISGLVVVRRALAADPADLF